MGTNDFVIENGVLKKYTGSGGAVVIPDGVTNIGQYAFFECASLTSVIMPDSVNFIGDRTFDGCLSLTSVTIPDTVNRIGWGAFSNTPWLENYPDDFVIGGKVLIKYKGKESILTIPDSVTCIGGSAFERCSSLISVIIPDSVTKIYNEAFYNCPNLTSVIVPDSVTEMGTCVFSACSKLTSLTYCGVTFSFSGTEMVHRDMILDMIKKHYFSMKINLDAKYAVIRSIFKNALKDEIINTYIKENFAEMFQYLIDRNDIETALAVIHSGKFITSENIDEIIRYAIDKRRTEIQVLLMDYKREKIGYSDPSEKLKL